jgi:hypothetical protein
MVATLPTVLLAVLITGAATSPLPGSTATVGSAAAAAPRAFRAVGPVWARRLPSGSGSRNSNEENYHDDDDSDDDGGRGVEEEDEAFCGCFGCGGNTLGPDRHNATAPSAEHEGGACGALFLDLVLEFVLPCLFFGAVALFFYRRRRENERVHALRVAAMRQPQQQMQIAGNQRVVFLQQTRNQVASQMVIQPARQPQQVPMVPMVPMQQQQRPQMVVAQGAVTSSQAAGVPMAQAIVVPVPVPGQAGGLAAQTVLMPVQQPTYHRQ